MLIDQVPDSSTEKIVYAPKPIEGLDAYIGMIIVGAIVVLYFFILLIGSYYYDKRQKAQEEEELKSLNNSLASQPADGAAGKVTKKKTLRKNAGLKRTDTVQSQDVAVDDSVLKDQTANQDGTNIDAKDPKLAVID